SPKTSSLSPPCARLWLPVSATWHHLAVPSTPAIVKPNTFSALCLQPISAEHGSHELFHGWILRQLVALQRPSPQASRTPGDRGLNILHFPSPTWMSEQLMRE